MEINSRLIRMMIWSRSRRRWCHGAVRAVEKWWRLVQISVRNGWTCKRAYRSRIRIYQVLTHQAGTKIRGLLKKSRMILTQTTGWIKEGIGGSSLSLSGLISQISKRYRKNPWALKWVPSPKINHRRWFRKIKEGKSQLAKRIRTMSQRTQMELKKTIQRWPKGSVNFKNKKRSRNSLIVVGSRCSWSKFSPQLTPPPSNSTQSISWRTCAVISTSGSKNCPRVWSSSWMPWAMKDRKCLGPKGSI